MDKCSDICRGVVALRPGRVRVPLRPGRVRGWEWEVERVLDYLRVPLNMC